MKTLTAAAAAALLLASVAPASADDFARSLRERLGMNDLPPEVQMGSSAQAPSAAPSAPAFSPPAPSYRPSARRAAPKPITMPWMQDRQSRPAAGGRDMRPGTWQGMQAQVPQAQAQASLDSQAPQDVQTPQDIQTPDGRRPEEKRRDGEERKEKEKARLPRLEGQAEQNAQGQADGRADSSGPQGMQERRGADAPQNSWRQDGYGQRHGQAGYGRQYGQQYLPGRPPGYAAPPVDGVHERLRGNGRYKRDKVLERHMHMQYGRRW